MTAIREIEVQSKKRSFIDDVLDGGVFLSEIAVIAAAVVGLAMVIPESLGAWRGFLVGIGTLIGFGTAWALFCRLRPGLEVHVHFDGKDVALDGVLKPATNAPNRT